MIAVVTGAPHAAPDQPAAGLISIETFTKASAYPYDGQVPEQNKPFLEGPPGARYHIAPRGGKLMADTTYSDRRSLLVLPTAFTPATPGAAIVVFFHGNLATLQDVKGRQGVARQLLDSRLNAVLVAPQLAVNALDSSPGRFYEPGFLEKYLSEAEDHLVSDGKGRFAKAALAKLPVIIVAYSGGYLATAFTLHDAGSGSRIRGVVLLDALFGESAKIEDWITRTQPDTFFFSAFSKASAAQNADLEKALGGYGVPLQTTPPTKLAGGDIVFLAAPNAVHNDFVTRAWTADPLRAVFTWIRAGAAGPAPAHLAPANAPRQSACPVDAPACDPTESRPTGTK